MSNFVNASVRLFIMLEQALRTNIARLVVRPALLLT
jgi:hypothetical protein